LKKNISFFYSLPPNPENGGIERVSCILAEELSRKGYNIYYLHQYTSDDINVNANRYFKEIIQIDPKTNDLDIKIKSFLINTKIEIVIYQGGSMDFIKVIAQLKEELNISLFVVSHVPPVLDTSVIKYHLYHNVKDIKSLLKLIAIKLFPRLYVTFHYNKRQVTYHNHVLKLCDKYIFLSKYHITEIKEKYQVADSSKFCIIPNPITFNHSLIKSQIVKKEKIIFIVARMDEYQKRISVALKIWKSMEPYGYDGWKLLIVGNGRDRNFYDNIANKYKINNLSFEGQQNPLNYYKISSIFLMTSSFEGFGLTLLEAQQMGVVPIVFDSFSALHDIILDGHNGVIIKNNDLQSYKEQLLNLMRNSTYRNNLAKNAIDNSANFSKEKIVAIWENLFKENDKYETNNNLSYPSPK
jgi:glycosyltransferase involved in cell wall biosynthesis